MILRNDKTASQKPQFQVNRCQFLKGSVGLVVAMYIPFGNKVQAQNAAPPAHPNAFVRIASDSTVTVMIKHLEIGQGAFTGLATLVAVVANATHIAFRGADALDIEWDNTDAETRSTEQIMAAFKQQAQSPGNMAHEHGDVGANIKAAKQIVE